MSLDVYLSMPDAANKPEFTIFIREAGRTFGISREEWDRRFPGEEPCEFQGSETNHVFHSNITHNLGKMAENAGIYQYLWRPEELGITKAKQLIEPLRNGLRLLYAQPEHFEPFNPTNKWGDYHGLVRFVEDYLKACEQFPDATVEASR